MVYAILSALGALFRSDRSADWPGVARSGTCDVLRSEPQHSERHAAQILSVEERHVEHIKNDVLGAGGVTATTQSYRLEIAFIDLREKNEREKYGAIPGSLHAPYPELAANIAPGGLLRGLAANQRLLFYCAFGERSAMAVQTAQDGRLTSACHLQGGIDAWKKANGPLVR